MIIISHQRRLVLPLFLLIVIAGLSACQKTSFNDELLIRAESIVNEYPERALSLLENEIYPNNLSKQQFADWALLITRAQDKCYIEHTSDSLISKSVAYYEKRKDSDKLMMAYYYMGCVNRDMRLAPREQEYYHKALAAGKESKDYYIKGLIANDLGILYTSQYAWDLALPYLQEAHDYYKLLDDTQGISYALRDIARVHHQKEQLDSALYYYEKGLANYHQDTQGDLLRELSGVLLKAGDYSSALSSAQQALPLQVTVSDQYSTFYILGQLYLKTGQLDSAHYYLEKSLKSPRLTTKAGSYLILSELSEIGKDWEKSAQLKDQYIQLAATIERDKNSAAMQQMDAMYNFQQIEQEAEVLRLQKAKAKDTLTWLIVIAIVFVIAIVAFGALYYYFQLRSFQEQKDILLKFINRQQQNNSDQLKENENRLAEINKETSVKKTKRTMVLNLEKNLLEAENKRIKQELEKEVKLKVEISRLEFISKLKDPAEKIKSKDIFQLIEIIDNQYPYFKDRLIESGFYADKLNLQICYLLKVGIKSSRIGNILCKSRQAISKRCSEMNANLQKKDLSLRTLDDLINS